MPAAAAVNCRRFITPHAANKNYKASVKALLRVTTDPLSSHA
jgi:hypothetical protein